MDGKKTTDCSPRRAKNKMEEESNRFEILTPLLDKKKKKKKRSASKERHRKHSQERLRDSSLVREQPEATPSKRKKKKASQQPRSSPLKQFPIWGDPEEATSIPKKHKKKTKRELEVEEEAVPVYALVDKENIESTPRNCRGDYAAYVEKNKARKSKKGHHAGVLGAAPESAEEESALRPTVSRKKHREQPGKAARRDAAQESWPAGPAPAHAGTEEQECLPSTELPGSAGKRRSKKKKKKKHRSQEVETLAAPESPGAASPESPQRVDKAGTVQSGESGDAPEEARDPSRAKKKSKKRKHASVTREAAAGDTSEPPEPDSPPVRGGVKRRPHEELAQAPPRRQRMEEAPRVEPTNEEEEDLWGLADDPETSCSARAWRDSPDPEVDLDHAVKELREFIPDIGHRAAASVKRMYREDLQRFREFRAQGVPIRFGKFSAKENKQLEKNVEEFLALTGIESADKLLYADRYPEEKLRITNLKRKYAFRVHIGKGIARPWKPVYYRAKKMFDVNNYKGRYSTADIEKLKRYQFLHGNNWKKIGELVSRSSLSVALKFSQISSRINHGAWSKTETQKLIKAVKEVILKKMSLEELQEVDSRLQENPEQRLEIVREKLYKGISWVEVAAKVESRNWMQCKSKWTDILTKRMNYGEDVYRGVNALQAKIILIERLYEINVEDSNEIDWEDLASAIGDVPPSFVQTKFYRLKATCVPFWQRKTFPEIIDYLYETSLPLLKGKLEKTLARTGSEVQPPVTPRPAFLFQDIFYCDDEDSEDEDPEERV
ncbi:transcription termination factor 1 [Ochotona princeps]|uniref:transcription termination factor 1 n=1 Tax=Ochotona princeps TaxID=9978 RepID=UPI002714F30D|nr:transcription termination factor 1 [Ochotona princeps]